LLIASHAAVAVQPPSGNSYVQTNLVSDLPGVAAATDPNLINPWGITASATSPMWISDNGTGVSTLYNGAGTVIPLVVTIPPPAGGTGAAPTGTVFNTTTQFLVGGNPAKFLFATEDGTISGWNGGTAAVLEVDNSSSGAVYKGLALGANASGPLLYATNFHDGTVDVYDGTWALANLSGGFVDWFLPKGYAPFGIMTTPDNHVIVTYAMQDAAMHDDVAGYGHGFVDEFDADGNLVRRLISGGELDSPWGLAMAPDGFGQFGGALLVGNFGDGRINAYHLRGSHGMQAASSDMGGQDDFFRGRFFGPGATFLGTLRDPDGHPITNLGLWALHFGSGSANGGAATSLYFTAGIPGSVGTLDVLEQHGLFGVLNPSVGP
jgi:uncharacterized protein (TIGR03118 family)